MSQPSDLDLLYRELLAFSEQQKRALEARDAEGFLDLSARRDRVFERLTERAPSPRDVPRGVVERLLETDQAIMALVGDFTSSAGEELRRLRLGLDALHSYLPQNGGRPAFFIDRSQ